eukprot:1097587_1
MRSLFLVLATAICAVKSDYDWDYDPYGGDLDQEECVFSGSVDNENSYLCQKRTINRYDFKIDNDLSWKALTKACPGLVYGGCADPTWGSDHSMADELEWASCGDCPRCPCDRNQPDTYYIKNYTQFAPPFEVKVCYECSCNEYIADDNIYALYCYPERTFNSPEELKDVQCPYTTPAPTPAPTGGCDGAAGIIYPPGSYFFYYDTDKCETYCTCNIENERECETGWSNIMGNEQLKYRFLDTCHSGLYDAWDDYTRWDTPGSCTVGMMASNYRCPTANCDGLTGTWEGLEYKSATYDDDGNFERAIFDCVDCSCAVNSVTSCNAYDEDELSADACSRETLLCSVGDEWGDLDPISCNVGDGEAYCGWSEFKAIDGFDPDRVCIESYIENGPRWECMDAYTCEAFYGKDELEDSSKGLCAAQQMSFTVASYDCIDYKWVSETYTFDGNHMCCTGSNECNEQDVSATALGDSNTCSSNSRISTYYKVMFECTFGDKGLGNNDFSKYSQCSVPLPEDKYDVCDLLEPYWKQGTFCSCRAMQVIEKMYPSDDYHDGLREQLQLAFDSDYAYTKATLEMWNEGYDCGKTFQCDITADDGVDQVDAPITDDEVDYDWSYSPYSGDLDQEECVFSGS